jgi:hypothetical protein
MPGFGDPVEMWNLTVWNLSDYSNWTVNEYNGGHGVAGSGVRSVMDVVFSHNSTLIASCSMDDTVKVWNSTTGAKVVDLDLGTTDVLTVQWSPDDTQIAAGLANGSIVIFNLTNTSAQNWLAPHTGRVNSISWNPAGDELVSGASEPHTKVWDVGNKIPQLNITGHLNSVHSVDWTSDGQSIITGGGNTYLRNMFEIQIFCVISSDSGGNFTTPKVVSDNYNAKKTLPRVGMDSSSTVHVVWYITSGGVGIFYTNSSDGQTFAGDVQISSGLEWVTPDIAVEANGQAHVVWQQKNGKANIHYANSSDNFSRDIQLTSEGQFPRIATSDSGSTIWVTWRPTGNTSRPTYNLTANASYDNGLTFGDPTNIATNISRHAVAVDEYGQTSFVWVQTFSGQNEIYHTSTVLQDNWRPTVTGTVPAHGASGVSAFTNILVNFSEPMDRSSVENAFSIFNGTHTLDQSDCSVITWNGYGDKLNFSLTIPLNYNGFYSVTIANTATDISGNALATDHVFSFTTSDDIDPPIIEHTQPSTEWGYDQPYPVEARIIDWWGSVSSANLHYRGVSDTGFTLLALTHIGSNNYTATIPAQGVLGNVSYYFTAADNHGNSGRLPVNPVQTFNYTVGDATDPEITHIPETTGPVHEPIVISAVVSDDIYLYAVDMNYMGVGEINFTKVQMTPNTTFDPDGYSCTIPAQLLIGDLVYNITATDSSNNTASTNLFTVAITDLTKPEINSVTPEYLANDTEVLVRADITDNVAVEEVTLYFKAVGGDHWVERNMNNVGGDIYEFTIPAQRKSGTIYYYVNATDTSGNLASTLTEQDQFQVEVIGTGSDNTVYYALAIVLIALVVVLVYLVVTKFGGKKPDSPPEEAPGGKDETEPKADEPEAQPKQPEEDTTQRERVGEDEGQ